MRVKLIEGRSAIVTGAARGIGLTIAERFLEHGASVVVCDLDEAVVAAAVERLSEVGPQVDGIRCDVTDEHDVAALVGHTVEQHGGLDVFVNNAGITADRMMHRMSLDEFRRVIDVNLVGAWLGTREAMRVMREQDTGGSIVNLSSISGRIGNAGQTNYSAAKAGIVGLTKAASKEGGRYGVRVNALQPGLIRTPMTDEMPADVLDARIAQVPLGRIGETADVADAALFLASDLSSYLTGVVIPVSGGRQS